MVTEARVRAGQPICDQIDALSADISTINSLSGTNYLVGPILLKNNGTGVVTVVEIADLTVSQTSTLIATLLTIWNDQLAIYNAQLDVI